MKKASLLTAVILGVALMFGATGCKHKGIGITPIPGMNTKVGGTDLTGPGGTTGATTDTSATGVPMSENDPYHKIKNGPHTEDREVLAAQTIYFDTDSATIKKSEQSKLQAVADYMKGNANNAVEVEGHCDERGTEGYNQTLGNKRALAIREYLGNLGADAGHVGAVSYGEAKPADPGHDEAAWKKNRRGVFVVLIPKQ